MKQLRGLYAQTFFNFRPILVCVCVRVRARVCVMHYYSEYSETRNFYRFCFSALLQNSVSQPLW